MNSAKALVKRLTPATEKLESKVKTFLSKPDVETVHDIRTTSRRIQAYSELLPKNVRKKRKVASYLGRARSLFKATTPIRDFDIIQSKLSKFDTDPAVKQLLDKKKETRDAHLKTAFSIATSLNKIGAPRFKTNQISESKLSKRRRKVLRKYQVLLVRQMKLENPTIEQLHEFRKTCKMLRYTLEADSRKNDTITAQLVKIQGCLGVIMDVRTTLDALSELSMSEFSGTITGELNAEKDKASMDYLAIKQRFALLLKGLITKEN